MVGLHHIVRPLASWVVACSTVQESPGDGAWAAAMPPPPTAIGENPVTVVHATNRHLLN
ncbi:hypothetical protein [Mycobacterium gastri]|uniref:hypothetical protein n=1 Tax=Mycobacterium gastri TaxID=1777 RepID=UPI0003E46E55|nr:hypothetical protein [Mycobacterium gastri]ETW24712.1 hypothetical protein MGAST_06920 [Mycobacterium gastri 'Wayne']